MILKSYLEKLEQEGQVYLLCKIFPGSSDTKIKEIVFQEVNNKLTEVISVSVSAPADKNKANQALIKFLAQEFDTTRGSVIIISGKTERLKLIKITK